MLRTIRSRVPAHAPTRVDPALLLGHVGHRGLHGRTPLAQLTEGRAFGHRQQVGFGRRVGGNCVADRGGLLRGELPGGGLGPRLVLIAQSRACLDAFPGPRSRRARLLGDEPGCVARARRRRRTALGDTSGRQRCGGLGRVRDRRPPLQCRDRAPTLEVARIEPRGDATDVGAQPRNVGVVAAGCVCRTASRHRDLRGIADAVRREPCSERPSGRPNRLHRCNSRCKHLFAFFLEAVTRRLTATVSRLGGRGTGRLPPIDVEESRDSTGQGAGESQDGVTCR